MDLNTTLPFVTLEDRVARTFFRSVLSRSAEPKLLDGALRGCTDCICSGLRLHATMAPRLTY